MAQISQFSAVRFSRKDAADISNLIAPPFDVLGEADRAALKARDPHNIVNIDLPHIPPRAAGPAAAYEASNITLQAWLTAGIISRDARPGLYPYAQTFDHNGRTCHRRGFFALVRLSPFGQGHVIPHEKTHAGAIEDRLALMNATSMQMSPIFGLFSDPHNEVTGALYRDLGRPEQSGMLDGVKHDLWSVRANDVANHVIDFMGTRPIYIADGHHRYTTALQYQKEAEQRNGGPLAAHDPANFCLFVLIGLQDEGLIILPTHRLIGNLKWFDIDAFQEALGDNFQMIEIDAAPEKVSDYVDAVLPKQPAHTLAAYDAKTRKVYELRLKNLDVLKKLEPSQSEPWRQLDVAILQRYVFDEILKPHFAEGAELTRSYTSDSKEIVPLTNGTDHQLAFMLQSTPLHALEELGKHGEVMPPKSTYFYPKLATGVVMNSLK